ncbi:MAG: hypothetical protein MUF27_00140 [Acidobacteria bacterium]|jgi:hypothetical protein|nr:hypothetical protein [Acidobacteriota bacterium]
MKLAVVLLQILLLVTITAVVAGGGAQSGPPDTPQETPKSGDGPGPGPAPGPIVVIKGGTGGAGISFQVDEIAQTAGSPTTGLLRGDFIGQSVRSLECKNRTTGIWGPASSISITDEGDQVYRLVIEKTAQKTLWWTLEEKQPSPPRTIALRPSNPTPGKVPAQFLELSAGTMRTGANVACSEVRFQVNVAE